MKRKNIILLGSIFLLATVLLFANGGAEKEISKEMNSEIELAFPVEKSSALPDLQQRTVIAVTENNYVPLQFIEPATGDAIGFEYDLTNLVAYLLNINIDWKTTSWATMISAVEDGQYDIGMTGISVTEERKKVIDFSTPYLNSTQSILVRVDEDRFSTAEEFAADETLLVGAQPGTTQFYTAVYEILDGDENNARIIKLDSFSLNVQSLLSKDVDIVLMDGVAADGYIKSSGNKLKVIGEPLGEDSFAYILTKGSDLKAPIDQALEYLKDKGIIEKLEKKWFYEYNLDK